MRAKDYSQAVFELIQNGTSESVVFTNLSAMLKKRGHEKLYGRILRELQTLAEKQVKRETTTVTVAKSEDVDLHKDAIAKTVSSLNGTAFTTVVDPTITGGFIAEKVEKRIDASYKKTLLTLYRSLIK